MPWRRYRPLRALARYVIPLSLGVLLFMAPILSPIETEFLTEGVLKAVTFAAGVATAAMSVRPARVWATAVVLMACAMRGVAFMANGIMTDLPLRFTLYGGYVWVVLGLLVVGLFLLLEVVDPEPHPHLFPDARP